MAISVRLNRSAASTNDRRHAPKGDELSYDKRGVFRAEDAPFAKPEFVPAVPAYRSRQAFIKCV